MDFNLSLFYLTVVVVENIFFSFYFTFSSIYFPYLYANQDRYTGIIGRNVRGKNRNVIRTRRRFKLPDNRRMTKAQRCLITLQLALIITLARRAIQRCVSSHQIGSASPCFVRYLLFSAVVAGFVLFLSLCSPPPSPLFV